MGCENGSLFILHIECYRAQSSSNLVLVRLLKRRGDSKLLYSAACTVCQLLLCYHTVKHSPGAWLLHLLHLAGTRLKTVLKKCKSCNGQVYFYQLAPRTVSEITSIFLGYGL